MLVKTFTAEDMPQALQKVKQTLGADALILSTRTLRKKGLGLLGKPLIEVTAAIESPAMADPHQRATATSAAGIAPKAVAAYQAVDLERSQKKPQRDGSRAVIEPLEMELNQLRQMVADQNVGDLQRELAGLKSLVSLLVENRAQLQSPAPAAAIKTPAAAAPRVLPTASASLTRVLSECGIDAEAVETIARFADARMSAEQRRDPQLQHEYLREMIADLLQISPAPWGPASEGQRRIALVGPTGVGKTTTLAKLAATATAAGARVALITIDTFRIAAVEQLKVYAEIMQLPVEVVFSPDQLHAALNNHRDKDLILIDTAGRSPQDHESIAELAGFFTSNLQIENWLVLAAQSEERVLYKTVENFSPLVPASLVFTKLDECLGWGVLLNLPTRTGLPLACLTHGQQVPEDLLMAEAQLVASWVLGHEPQIRKDAV
ncbi:MAG: flagellar biosynthesis protein FlhF [Deltaproteobacteria bacterium]|nr:flagellar biosynthesis protein FlhF [Deltaproteobacteria bacterium]NCP02713.1 flagellar biosynthesis protein FlhF [Deltaproteobacteria bacterium]NCP77587.1 flagellar biosynthesis protein FlhF [Desulfuromonadales bacterium]